MVLKIKELHDKCLILNIENCEALTGYKKEIAVGALFNCVETEISTTEFKNIIKDFLNRKVE